MSTFFISVTVGVCVRSASLFLSVAFPVQFLPSINSFVFPQRERGRHELIPPQAP